MHTITFPLAATKSDRYELDQRFTKAWMIKNGIIRHAKKLIGQLRRNREYQTLLDEYHKVSGILSAPGILTKDGIREAEEKKALLASSMNTIREGMGLTESGLQKYAKPMQAVHKASISSQQAQVIASEVWRGVEKILFSDGKAIRFKKNAVRTISGKSAANGIRFYPGYGEDCFPKSIRPVKKRGPQIEWTGLQIRVKADLEDPYVAEALTHKVKYCSIKRRAFNEGWRYYLVLTLDGAAPKKISMGTSACGLDRGTSTVAAVSGTKAMLEELAPGCADYERKIQKLQASVDRTKKKLNPGNYNPDGTIKKGRHDWILSGTAKKKQQRIRCVKRKQAEAAEHRHNYICNRLIEDSRVFISEPMDFRALAKRAKGEAVRADKVSEVKKKDGTTAKVRKFRKKKRFGKSVGARAPAKFLVILKRKLAQYGGKYYEVDSREFRASQYHHDIDEFIRTTLKERWKDIGRHRVQRDLYSAFLLKNADDALEHADRGKCLAEFEAFCQMADALILDMQMEGKSMPACFGF